MLIPTGKKKIWRMTDRIGWVPALEEALACLLFLIIIFCKASNHCSKILKNHSMVTYTMWGNQDTTEK